MQFYKVLYVLIKQHPTWFQLGILVAVATSMGSTSGGNQDEAKAVAEIEKLGGTVTVDDKSTDKPVIGVSLSNTKATDPSLEYLKGLKEIRSLSLGNTKVTDSGFKPPQGIDQTRSAGPSDNTDY